MGKRLRGMILCGIFGCIILGLVGCSNAGDVKVVDGKAATPTPEVAKEGESPEDYILEIEHNIGDRVSKKADVKSEEDEEPSEGKSNIDDGNDDPEVTDNPKDSETKKGDSDSAKKYTTVMVIASSVNLREKPSLESEVVENVKYGTLLDRMEEGDEWDKLWYEGQEVYAFAEYLQLPDEVEKQGDEE